MFYSAQKISPLLEKEAGFFNVYYKHEYNILFAITQYYLLSRS